MYELFGTRNGLLEFLGVFHTEDFALKAYYELWGCGYQNLKLCKWKSRQQQALMGLLKNCVCGEIGKHEGLLSVLLSNKDYAKSQRVPKRKLLEQKLAKR